MIKIRVNRSFQDKYTGTLYEVGKVIEVEEKRLEELKDFDNDLVSFIEEVEDKKPKKPSKEDEPKEDKLKGENLVDEPTDDGKPVDDASKEDKEEK